MREEIIAKCLKLMRHMEAERVTLFLRVRGRDQFRTFYAKGVSFDFCFQIGEGLVGKSIKEKRILFDNNMHSSAESLCRYRDSTTKFACLNTMIIPIFRIGRVIGAIQLLNKKNGFTKADRLLALKKMKKMMIGKIIREVKV